MGPRRQSTPREKTGPNLAITRGSVMARELYGQAWIGTRRSRRNLKLRDCTPQNPHLAVILHMGDWFSAQCSPSSMWGGSMKTTLFAMLVICATGAMAQGYGAAVMSTPYQFPEHPEYAERHLMATEQNLRGKESPYTFEKGEIPLKDVVIPSTHIPLGDVARRVRLEHETAKKADIVWVD